MIGVPEPVVVGDQPVVLVGEAPSLAVEGRPELWLRADDSGRPHAANRLAAICGLTADRFNAAFARTNLLDYCPTRPSMGRSAGDRWSTRDARARASALLRALGGRRVVLLGRRVQLAVLRRRVDWFAWREWSEDGVAVPWAAIPHPSGRCRLYNDEAVRERAGALLRAELA